mgnify:FL=1|tara:strand:+ start:295 stop:2328 length:2034 start_codon:yes stop_codon:yes gene_type:complete
MADIKDYKELDDDEIVNLLDDNIKRSVGYYDSQISRERQQVMDYYNATKPKPAHDGNSKYVSMDVYDAVEAMKAALLETFSAGNRIVRFAPQGAEDVATSRVCSEYTDYVAFRQNDMFSVMSSVIHDGLIARAGIAKAYWADQTNYQVQSFENLTESELDMLLAQDDVELVSRDTDEVGLTSGEISYQRDASQVVIEAIAPEEFIIEPQAKSLDDVNFCAHRTTKTLSELREEGYDEELLSDIGDHEDVDMETDPEVLSRHENIGSDRGFNATGYQDQVRSVMVYEAYVMLDVDGTGIAQLHKVVKAGNVLLDIQTVDRKPFFAFVPLPIPHAFYGSNFADKLVATQNARTVLTRSILDHAMITNNPRYMVTKGGLTNPRELIDNRVGGIVNVSRPDAIAPMPQAPLNPFIFQTIKLLDDDKEENTGVSRLSQGLNKDAISKQNSAAMVEQLATMSQQRQKIIARNFANKFLKPLFHEIYRLCVENEDQEKIVEIGGEYVAINPSRWEDQRDTVVELNLGYGEQEREAQKYMGMHQVFSQDPNLARMYTPENQYALMIDVMNMTGIKNTSDYLTSPDQLPEEKPNEMAMVQMQMAQKQLEIQERQTRVAEMKAEVQTMIDKMKLDLDRAKIENDLAIKSDGMDLKEQQFAHKQRIDAAELELANRADQIKAIASPQG